jgi:hypothetical protein
MYHARLLGDYATAVDETVLTHEDAAVALGPVAGSRMAYLDEWTDHKGKRPANRIKALTQRAGVPRPTALPGLCGLPGAAHVLRIAQPEASLPYADAGSGRG